MPLWEGFGSFALMLRILRERGRREPKIDAHPGEAREGVGAQQKAIPKSVHQGFTDRGKKPP